MLTRLKNKKITDQQNVWIWLAKVLNSKPLDAKPSHFKVNRRGHRGDVGDASPPPDLKRC